MKTKKREEERKIKEKETGGTFPCARSRFLSLSLFYANVV